MTTTLPTHIKLTRTDTEKVNHLLAAINEIQELISYVPSTPKDKELIAFLKQRSKQLNKYKRYLDKLEDRMLGILPEKPKAKAKSQSKVKEPKNYRVIDSDAETIRDNLTKTEAEALAQQLQKKFPRWFAAVENKR